MEVILKEDIKGLGYKNDVVSVRPGYGRNYLIPQGFAIMASDSNKKVISENVRQAAHKAEKVKSDAISLSNQIGESVFAIKAKVGDTGKIFGAITSLQISDALKLKGFDVDRKKISIKGEVKHIGQYSAVLDLHKDVKHEVKFEVISE
ncbi:MAG: 50S ribosomal protein L9 [Cytophagales bacterium]|nr:MAG: 50S ribosomal protein L9 [Cytophagales bacterium]